MSASLFFIILLAGLFLFSFITKRRFGVLGLALAAGALISESWAATLTPAIEQQGIYVAAPPLEVLVRSVLLLLPPVILLFSGPMYTSKLWRFIGSLIFALLATTFLFNYFAATLQFDHTSAMFALVIETYRPYIVVAGLSLAVLDTFLLKTPKFKRPRREKHE
ncbi:MAG TPA: hypothetical protein VD907_00645 [Verrucomicrobiae bacterium]|nr:hypothetical protein [Verrucomicrobiae bacterium]